LAGKPGQLPFRVIYHPTVTPTRLIEFCQQLGFRVIHFLEYEGDQYERVQQQNRLIGTLLIAAVGVANVLTLSRRDLKKGDYHIVLEKRLNAAAAALP